MKLWFFVVVLAATISVRALHVKDNALSQILEAVERIEQQLQKEDRLREVAQLVNIDASLKSLERKFSGDRPRVSDSSINSRLQSLETTVEALQNSLYKMEESIAHSWDSERKRIDDLDTKLRKMSNIITALYEMNKEMKRDIRGEDRVTSLSDSSASEFLLENLEEMERKIKEQMSVVSAEMRRELSAVKQMAFSIMERRCENSLPEVDEFERESLTTKEDRRSKNEPAFSDMLNNLMRSINRGTREIKEEVQNLGQRLITTSLCSPNKEPTLPPLFREFRGSNTTCSTATSHIVTPKSCAELRKGGATCDGVYIIFLQPSKAVRVYCDMTTDGGGWTVIMRRGDYGLNHISFNQNWNSYKEGFGDIEKEFWLGNDNIHFLTSQETNSLRVRLDAFDDDKMNLNYNYFLVEDEDRNYRMILGLSTESSVMSNTLLHHNNKEFSTYDRKNSNSTENCADMYKGGWWFNQCYYGFLTGEYFRPGERKDRWRGILWYDWKKDEALRGAEMMVRPNDMT